MDAGEALMSRPGCCCCRQSAWARGHAPQERSANDSPAPGARDGRPVVLGAGAGAEAAELFGPVLAQSPSIVARPGPLSESLQVHPRGADLPALDLDYRLGRARHQRAEQCQVRDLEQRGLFLGHARADPDLRNPDLPPELDPAFAGLLRADPDLFVCSQPDRSRRPEGAHAVPPGRSGQRSLAEAGHQALVQQGRDQRGPDRSADHIRRQERRHGQGRPQPGASGRGIPLVHGRQGAGLRRGAAPGHGHPPRADHRTAFGTVPDRRHPARRRAVRSAHRRCRDQRLQGSFGDGHLREAETARRLVRRQAAGSRSRLPRCDLGLQVRREAGHANSRQLGLGSPSSKTWACDPS